MQEDQKEPDIPPYQSLCEGWEEQFEVMAALGDDKLLDEIVPTAWDDGEWTW